MAAENTSNFARGSNFHKSIFSKFQKAGIEKSQKKIYSSSITLACTILYFTMICHLTAK